jgi:hypothetical protein
MRPKGWHQSLWGPQSGAPHEKCSMRPKTGYNFPMQVATFIIRMLETMFFVGLAGSTVVVIISFIEDAKELFGDE